MMGQHQRLGENNKMFSLPTIMPALSTRGRKHNKCHPGLGPRVIQIMWTAIPDELLLEGREEVSFVLPAASARLCWCGGRSCESQQKQSTFPSSMRFPEGQHLRRLATSWLHSAGPLGSSQELKSWLATIHARQSEATNFIEGIKTFMMSAQFLDCRPPPPCPKISAFTCPWLSVDVQFWQTPPLQQTF